MSSYSMKYHWTTLKSNLPARHIIIISTTSINFRKIILVRAFLLFEKNTMTNLRKNTTITTTTSTNVWFIRCFRFTWLNLVGVITVSCNTWICLMIMIAIIIIIIFVANILVSSISKLENNMICIIIKYKKMMMMI